MKNLILCLLFITTVALAGDQPRPRFEKLYEEEISGKVVQQMTVFHDKESGVEFICAESIRATGYAYAPTVSCWNTGRIWK